VVLACGGVRGWLVSAHTGRSLIGRPEPTAHTTHTPPPEAARPARRQDPPTDMAHHQGDDTVSLVALPPGLRRQGRPVDKTHPPTRPVAHTPHTIIILHTAHHILYTTHHTP
jgi:hypothetical protein